MERVLLASAGLSAVARCKLVVGGVFRKSTTPRLASASEKGDYTFSERMDRT
jgi:hypothetical protein